MELRAWRWTYVVLGIALRIALLSWGTYQDAHARVPYTDVDYAVFNDGAEALLTGCPLSRTVESPLYEVESDLLDVPELAASTHCARGIVPAIARFLLVNDPRRLIAEGGDGAENSLLYSGASFSFALMRPMMRFFATVGDPFARDTYRYTPLLALLLAPAHVSPTAWRLAGKLLFALADIGCALLMWRIIDRRAERYARLYPAIAGAAGTHLPGVLWLLNPFPAQIATRGSSDSVVGFFVLLFLAMLLYATPETALVDGRDFDPPADQRKSDLVPAEQVGVMSDVWFYGAAVALALAAHLKMYPVVYGASVIAHLANYRRHALSVMSGVRQPSFWQTHSLAVQFAAVAGGVYLALGLGAYAVWGEPYMANALLHHLVRKDYRHNFSAYFLPSYMALTYDVSSLPSVQEAPWILRSLLHLLSSPFAAFVPQMGAVAVAGLLLGGRDLVLACAVQTVVFVAWNKVYTSQYFLWYLWFVPVVAVTMRFTSTAQALSVISAWATAQSVWLMQAYQLEFEAQDTFVCVWLSSLALMAVQAWCTLQCIGAWSRWREEQRAAHHRVK